MPISTTGQRVFESLSWKQSSDSFSLASITRGNSVEPPRSVYTISFGQGIYVQASRPGLNKIPFPLVQLFAIHKTNSYVDRTVI